MNNKTTSIIGLTVLSILLFSGGIWLGQGIRTNMFPNWMMGNSGLMNGQYGNEMGNSDFMNGQNGNGMGNSDLMNGQYGSMMGEMGMMNGSYGNGMTGFNEYRDADPMTIEETESIVSTYLATFSNDDLDQGEIMIFDNHAYVQIVDASKDSGAFELLVDFDTGSVFPEPGPNLMWNIEYGMMAVSGEMNMMGGNRSMGQMNGNFDTSMMNENMSGNFGNVLDVEINFTATEAVNIAQDYLDANSQGKMADETADVFPGYYTLHVLENENTVGMLSVNAYTGQVFYHFWHGELVELSEEDHS